jgi:hypothetical protein
VPTIFIPVDVPTSVYEQVLALVDLQRADHADQPDDGAEGADNTDRLRRFATSLPESGQRVLMSIASACRERSTPVSRVTLGQQVGLTDPQLSGVFGTIGRRWAEAFGTATPNEFIGRRLAPSTDVFYAIDPQLANALIAEIQADADRWRAGVTPGR